MGLFSKPEVVILKESCDSKEYLEKLKELRASIADGTDGAKKVIRDLYQN